MYPPLWYDYARQCQPVVLSQTLLSPSTMLQATCLAPFQKKEEALQTANSLFNSIYQSRSSHNPFRKRTNKKETPPHVQRPRLRTHPTRHLARCPATAPLHPLPVVLHSAAVVPTGSFWGDGVPNEAALERNKIQTVMFCVRSLYNCK